MFIDDNGPIYPLIHITFYTCTNKNVLFYDNNETVPIRLPTKVFQLSTTLLSNFLLSKIDHL